MLFFRSEDSLQTWCAARGVTPGPIVSMDQLWGLATRWYATRLTAEARRPRAEEMRQVFSDLGLTESFWDPRGDQFR